MGLIGLQNKYEYILCDNNGFIEELGERISNLINISPKDVKSNKLNIL